MKGVWLVNVFLQVPLTRPPLRQAVQEIYLYNCGYLCKDQLHVCIESINIALVLIRTCTQMYYWTSATSLDSCLPQARLPCLLAAVVWAVKLHFNLRWSGGVTILLKPGDEEVALKVKEQDYLIQTPMLYSYNVCVVYNVLYIVHRWIYIIM